MEILIKFKYKFPRFDSCKFSSFYFLIFVYVVKIFILISLLLKRSFGPIFSKSKKIKIIIKKWIK